MKIPRRLTHGNVWLFGALTGWSLLFLACTTTTRTIVSPVEIAGAEYVGSSECAMCHDDVVSGFKHATHFGLTKKGDQDLDISCEACHGPGSKHVQIGGSRDTIVNPGRDTTVCYQCHLDKRGEFALQHAHPVASGQMSCTDCHNPHSGSAVAAGGTEMAGPNDSCLDCHNAQRGPFVFEHEASREGCVACHSPHGSVNPKMLKARNQNLCLQCHFQQQTGTGLFIGGRDHGSFLSRGTCWTAGCHEAVHGSHVNSSLRF